MEELSSTARGSRGFGYSAHDELAEPDDPTYHHQEAGTRNPCGSHFSEGYENEVGEDWDSDGYPWADIEHRGATKEAELHPARPEPAGHHRVPDPDLNHRGAYDYEAETARRAELGLTFASGNSEPPRERATQGGTPSAGDRGR